MHAAPGCLRLPPRRHGGAPQRQRRLYRSQGHRHVFIPVVLALEGQPRTVQALDDQVHTLHEHFHGVIRVNAEETDFYRRHPATQAHFQPPVAEIVQHADLLNQPQRDIKRDQVHQRADAYSGSRLRQRRQEYAGRRRRAQGRAVVFRQVVAPETRGFRGLGNPDPFGVGLVQRFRAHVQVVENAEFYAHVVIVPCGILPAGYYTLNDCPGTA